MCQLCTENKKDLQVARDGLAQFAAKLEQMAGIVRGLADGKILPHTHTKPIEIQPLAAAIARELNENWGAEKAGHPFGAARDARKNPR